ncbi:MAG: CPBP family intramembrane metalloprotease [Clostridia bacterium]|nr:CPBP family intramembrane metalloprotease [Clostridia bacterium]
MEKKENLKYLLPIRSILFILVFVIGAAITKRNIGDISNWWSIVATVINLVTILILVIVTKKIGSNYWKLINYEKGKTKVKDVVIMSLIVLLVGTSGMYLAGFICYGIIPYSAPMMIAPIPMILAIINIIVLPLTVPFAEDGLYLGCGVNQIKNTYLAILIPAFFYALQHSFIPTLFDGKFIIYRFLSFLPLTIILCWQYHKKKNPVPIMVGHALIEVASVMMILATSISPELYQTMLSM